MSGNDEAAVEAGAKAFHDALREKKFLRWETSTEQYRQEMRALVRPAVLAAVAVERERCAKIAQNQVMEPDSDWAEGFGTAASGIASAIRHSP
jgi:hypothetical protein